jgi:proteasome alpha subunit
MAYSPYEWNESVRQRNEFIEDRLREGAPVVGVSYDQGILFLTIRRSQRKIYEIYDKLIFSAIGNQSDIETIRTGAIDIAHREGFTRSPDDVSIQRIVGFAVSPGIKKIYADPFAAPVAIRALFAELGRTPEADHYFVIGYDGEFSKIARRAAIAGSIEDEQRMLDELDRQLGKDSIPDFDTAVQASLAAWARGRMAPIENDVRMETAENAGVTTNDLLREAFALGGELEAAILGRDTRRESRFRMLRADEAERIAGPYKAAPV